MWRVNLIDHWHAWVKCFHVVDDNGELIEGGYKIGNNQNSGRPRFPRKMDAAAFIAGYNDCVNDKEGVTHTRNGELALSYGSGRIYAKSLGKRFDDTVAREYEAGAHRALRVIKNTPSQQSHPARKTLKV